MTSGSAKRSEEQAGLAVVLHELRGPAAAVVGAARTLALRGGELDPSRRRELLSLIETELARLGRMVRDLLDATGAARGELRCNFAPVDSAALVRETVAAATVAHPATPIRAELEGGLPSIVADQGRLRQALGNLVDNAVKFSPPGEPVDVHAVAAAAGGIRIDVRDRGPGVAAEHHALVFERFGRAPATGKPGSGLGLFVARAVAEAHGGSLTLSSAPGRGATFTLSLPSSPGRP